MILPYLSQALEEYDIALYYAHRLAEHIYALVLSPPPVSKEQLIKQNATTKSIMTN